MDDDGTAAVGGSAGAGAGTGAGSGGSSGAGAASGQGGAGSGDTTVPDAGPDSGGPIDDRSDEERLLECEAASPCTESKVSLHEGFLGSLDTPENTRCLLQVLAARTPGRYQHSTRHTYSNGTSQTQHTIVIEPDGSALYVAQGSTNGELAGDGPAQAKRCTLKPRAFFEGCAASIDDFDGISTPVWSCVYGDKASGALSDSTWFESCEVESPVSCEPAAGTVEQDGVRFRAFLEGDYVKVKVSDPGAIQLMSCSGTKLQRIEDGTAVAWHDDRPPSYNSPGYYLDGRYLGPTLNNGCDVLGCYDLNGDEVPIDYAREYVKTGTMAAPDDAQNAGEIVDVIETRAFSGDLVVTLAYSVAGECELKLVEIPLNVPEEGVCCPVGETACSAEGPGGGWAPTLAACPSDWHIEYDALFEQKPDVRGCPALVANYDECCNCPNE